MFERDRHAQDKRAFAFLDEPSVGLPTLESFDGPALNAACTALDQGQKLISNRIVMKRGVRLHNCARRSYGSFESLRKAELV